MPREGCGRDTLLSSGTGRVGQAAEDVFMGNKRRRAPTACYFRHTGEKSREN